MSACGFDDADAYDPFEQEEPQEDEDEMWSYVLPTDQDDEMHASHFMESSQDVQQAYNQAPVTPDGGGVVLDPVEQEAPQDQEEVFVQSDPYVTGQVVESPVEVQVTPTGRKRKRNEEDDMEITPPPLPLVKRVRLNGKQSSDNLNKPVPREIISLNCTFEQVSQIVRVKAGVDKVRDLYMKHERSFFRTANPQGSSPDINKLMRTTWAQMAKNVQLDWLKNCLSRHYGMAIETAPQPLIDELVKQQYAETAEDVVLGSGEGQMKAQGAMATWNGSWLMGIREFKDFLEVTVLEDVATHIKDLRCFQKWVGEFEEFLVRRVARLKFPFWSYVIEVSLKSEEKGRIHIHAYWHTDVDRVDARPFVGTHDAWRFQGSKPKIRPNTARGRHCQLFIDRGHFYCQCIKLGHVLCNTNYPKYEAFVVQQKWVIGLWQRRKVGHEDAKQELIGARGHTNSYLNEVQSIQDLEDKVDMENEKASIDAMLRGAFKPFKFVPEVSLWKLQYEREGAFGIWGKESRFKFLVLTGPSSLGKTQFAKSLFGISETLVVPCQGVANPSLKKFRRKQHKAILFDEVASSCIVNNKQVFQANNDIVLLGQSPCQRDIYSVFLYGIACICCTNDWMEDIKRGSSEEEWLLANSIVYECREKMWVEDEAA